MVVKVKKTSVKKSSPKKMGVPKKSNTKKTTYEKVEKNSKLGDGSRFKSLTQEIMNEGKSKASAKAIAASIGRKNMETKKCLIW